MSSLLDLFLYEIARAHQQELLASARVDRVLTTPEPISLRRWLRAIRRNVRQHVRSVEVSPMPQGRAEAWCPCFRAPKDAA